MSTPVSVRFPEDVALRLRRTSSRTGEPASGLVVRLVDEGMRMDEHPGIVFRDGPAGRRAGLAGGPDVWEVVVVLNELGRVGSRAAVAKTAKWLGLTESQVRTAEGYYGAYPAEIDDRIDANVNAANDARRASTTRAQLYG
jgi:hypothetical protein